MLQNIDPAPALAPAPAAKNLNVTNFFATKQQVSPALSLNGEKNTDTTGTNVAGPARCNFAKILAAWGQKKNREKTTLNPHSLVFATLLKDY